MNYERINVWTNTFYTLLQSLSIAKKMNFGELASIDSNARNANSWITPECSFNSTLMTHNSGGQRITFRRDPNSHFNTIARQIIKMLIQDLVVIFDEMMHEALIDRKTKTQPFPQSKIEVLSKHLDPRYIWSKHGCLEIIAVRNVLTHAGGIWNAKSIAIVSGFVKPPPNVGDRLDIGFGMLFRYRKAIRTFLSEVSKPGK